MLQDKLTANTPKGKLSSCSTRSTWQRHAARRGAHTFLKGDFKDYRGGSIVTDLENMIKATSDRFADDQGNLDLEWMSNEAERLMKTWEVERQTEKRLTRETPMQRSRHKTGADADGRGAQRTKGT